MKKILVLAILLVLVAPGFSQVFNTGQTLSTGVFNIGVQPVAIIDGPVRPMLFTHAGVGLKNGIDFSARAGFGRTDYFGGDIEFSIGRFVSLMAGGHKFGNFGTDGALLITFPIRKDIRLTTGIDSDVEFRKVKDKPNTPKNEALTELQPLVWLPVSLEIGLRAHMAFIFETEIGLNPAAYHLIGSGLNFYF